MASSVLFKQTFLVLLALSFSPITFASDPCIFDAEKNRELQTLTAWKNVIKEVQKTQSDSSFWKRTLYSKDWVQIPFPAKWLSPLGRDPNIQYPEEMKVAEDKSPLYDTFQNLLSSNLATSHCISQRCSLFITKANYKKAVDLIDKNIHDGENFNYCVVQEVGAFGLDGSACTYVPTITVRGFRVNNDCLQDVGQIRAIPSTNKSCFYSNEFYTSHCQFGIDLQSGLRFYYQLKEDPHSRHSYPDREMAFLSMLEDKACN